MKALAKACRKFEIKLPQLVDYSVRIPPGGRSGALVEAVITWRAGDAKPALLDTRRGLRSARGRRHRHGKDAESHRRRKSTPALTRGARARTRREVQERSARSEAKPSEGEVPRLCRGSAKPDLSEARAARRSRAKARFRGFAVEALSQT